MAPKQRNVVGCSSSTRIPPNPIVTKYCQRNAWKKVTYSLKAEGNANLKFKDLTSEEKHAFRERLSKLQNRTVSVPRLVDWDLFNEYECENELRGMMRMSYVYPVDGDSFDDLSWERAFSINEEVYLEWCMEFFSTMYFERKVNARNIMNEVCVWFRLCGQDHAYTLPGFAVALGLYEQDEVDHQLFEAHFSRLRRFEKDYPSVPAYWNRVGDPSCTRRNSATLRSPLMRVLHKLLVWGPFHRIGSQDKCQKPDLWIMMLLEETKDGNAAWLIAEYLSRKAPGIKGNSNICGGYYVTRLAKNLGYYNSNELAKCGEPKVSEIWDAMSFGKALNRRTKTLGAWIEPPPPQQLGNVPMGNVPMGNVQTGTTSSFNSGWGDWNRHLNEIECRDVWRDSMMLRNNYINDYLIPFFQDMAQEANYELPPYNPPNVPPYPFPYTSYPGPYPYPYPGYAPFPDPMPEYGRLPEVGGSSYDVGGSLSGAGGKKKKRRVRSEFVDEHYESESDDEDDDDEGDEMSEDDE